MPCQCGPARVETCCCPDDPIPAALMAQIEINSGGGWAVVGDVALNFSGGGWTGTGNVDGAEMSLELICDTGGPFGCYWTLEVVCGGSSTFIPVTASSCDPFELTFQLDTPFTCFTHPVRVTFTG